MQITPQDRRCEMYRFYKNKAKDGWYIRVATYDNGVKTYELTKDRNGYRDSCCFLAHDVAQAFKKEFGFIVRHEKQKTCALNFNPKEHVPSPGHKITFHYH